MLGMKTLLVAAALAMAACGGTEQAAAPSRFAGTWNGQAELSAAAPFTAGPAPKSLILIDMDASTVRLSGFCPNGSGNVDLVFDTDPAHAAVAHNVAICQPAMVGSCDETQLIFSFVDAEVLPDGSLRGLAAGFAIGCGASSVASITFTAQRGS